jgi:hypothetical protein
MVGKTGGVAKPRSHSTEKALEPAQQTVKHKQHSAGTADHYGRVVSCRLPSAR